MSLVLERNSAAQASAAPWLRESIANFVRGASIETSTKLLVEIDACAALLPPATDVYATYLPGTPWRHIVAIARRLRRVGMNPVPHIAARRLANAAVAAEFLASLRDEAGVTRALVIAGDSRIAVGPYASSLALVETGLLQAHGIRSIGFAGYPEGHATIGAQALLDALERKIAYATSHGMEPYIVSQFCFDGRVIVDWVRRLRARGISAPVRVGLAGPAAIRTLLNFGIRCGIGDSLRAFGAQPVSLTRLLMRHGPEGAVRAIAEAAPVLGIDGLHFFPFGGFAESARWIGAVSSGRFRAAEHEAGFALDEIRGGIA